MCVNRSSRIIFNVLFYFLSLILMFVNTFMNYLLNACIISCIIKLFINTPVLVSLQAVVIGEENYCFSLVETAL